VPLAESGEISTGEAAASCANVSASGITMGISGLEAVVSSLGASKVGRELSTESVKISIGDIVAFSSDGSSCAIMSAPSGFGRAI
jgi:hypothetical protein